MCFGSCIQDASDCGDTCMALCSPDQMAQALGFECTVTGYGMFSSEPSKCLTISE